MSFTCGAERSTFARAFLYPWTGHAIVTWMRQQLFGGDAEEAEQDEQQVSAAHRTPHRS